MTTTAIPRREEARAGVVRVVFHSELSDALNLALVNPVENTFVQSRIEAAIKDPWRLGGSLWGYFAGGGLESMLFVGANVVPVETTDQARSAFARELIKSGRRSSSILGPRDQVLDLWHRISPVWGNPRATRGNQPLLTLDSHAQGSRNHGVRAVDPDELSVLLPASIHMFTEEVGVSPIAHGGQAQYERRVAEVIEQGHAFAFIQEGEVLFKAEVGFVAGEIAQLQGVWVAPHMRGKGLAAPSIAQVVDVVQTKLAPIVSLYVNDFNEPALRTYTRVGFQQVGTFATVLF